MHSWEGLPPNHYCLLDSCVFILSDSSSSHGDWQLPLWSWGLGEWHIGGCIGGDAFVLTSIRIIGHCWLSRLCLRHGWWDCQGNEEGGLGPRCVVSDLADFWFSPSAAPHAMSKGRAQCKTKHVQMVLNIKYAASVSADGLQKCWFEGFNVGAGEQGWHWCMNIMLNRQEFVREVIKSVIEASKIKNWLWRIAGDCSQEYKELPTNWKHC